jgi:hypothetical protein
MKTYKIFYLVKNSDIQNCALVLEKTALEAFNKFIAESSTKIRAVTDIINFNEDIK